MSLAAVSVAVVGHTNTGKTSLLRTLTRDAGFGAVSSRASTTRHVEGAALMVDGQPLVELYDTPGLEDPIGLLEELEKLRSGGRGDRVDVLRAFLSGPSAAAEFEQEAKALRKVLDADLAVYVVDARDRVMAKHRDELEILGWSARPVLPVLNFVATREAQPELWRQQLARVNMHAVVEFDTVVLDAEGEAELFRKMQTLLDPLRPTLEAVIGELDRQRRVLIRASADLVAEMLIDVAAFELPVEGSGREERRKALAEMQAAVRSREQQCVSGLLELHRFRMDDVLAESLPLAAGRWGFDLFSREALKELGIGVGATTAAGAAAGLAMDAMLGGLSLGAGAATGAAIGAVYGTVRHHGRRFADRVRGYTELHVDEATLTLLTARQVLLLRALFRRGHASQQPITLDGGQDAEALRMAYQEIADILLIAAAHPNWSTLGKSNGGRADDERANLRDRLADRIAPMVTT